MLFAATTSGARAPASPATEADGASITAAVGAAAPASGARARASAATTTTAAVGPAATTTTAAVGAAATTVAVGAAASASGARARASPATAADGASATAATGAAATTSGARASVSAATAADGAVGTVSGGVAETGAAATTSGARPSVSAATAADGAVGTVSDGAAATASSAGARASLATAAAGAAATAVDGVAATTADLAAVTAVVDDSAEATRASISKEKPKKPKKPATADPLTASLSHGVLNIAGGTAREPATTTTLQSVSAGTFRAMPTPPPPPPPPPPPSPRPLESLRDLVDAGPRKSAGKQKRKRGLEVLDDDDEDEDDYDDDYEYDDDGDDDDDNESTLSVIPMPTPPLQSGSAETLRTATAKSAAKQKRKRRLDDDGDEEDDDEYEEDDNISGRSRRGTSHRGKDVRKRRLEILDDDDDNSGREMQGTGGVTSIEPTASDSWSPPTRKRLRQYSMVPAGMHAVQNIVDYKIRKNKVTEVMVRWAAPGKDEPKTEWVSADAIHDLAAFKDDMVTVDLWKASGRVSLRAYLQTKEGRLRKAPKIQGADGGQMSCGYTSVGVALELLGVENTVTEKRVADFRADGLRRRPDNKKIFLGVHWKALCTFIAQLLVIDMDVANINLYQGNRVGVEGIRRLRLEDGIYLIGGYCVGRVGHTFVAEIAWKGQSVRIYDNNSLEDPRWLAGWLFCISYVRRMDLVKPKA